MSLFDITDFQSPINFGNHPLALIWLTIVSIVMLLGPATLGTAFIMFLKAPTASIDKPKQKPMPTRLKKAA
jgi:hypothetical protein